MLLIETEITVTMSSVHGVSKYAFSSVPNHVVVMVQKSCPHCEQLLAFVATSEFKAWLERHNVNLTLVPMHVIEGVPCTFVYNQDGVTVKNGGGMGKEQFQNWILGQLSGGAPQRFAQVVGSASVSGGKTSSSKRQLGSKEQEAFRQHFSEAVYGLGSSERDKWHPTKNDLVLTDCCAKVVDGKVVGGGGFLQTHNTIVLMSADHAKHHEALVLSGDFLNGGVTARVMTPPDALAHLSKAGGKPSTTFRKFATALGLKSPPDV